jgi:hypothetical protein
MSPQGFGLEHGILENLYCTEWVVRVNRPPNVPIDCPTVQAGENALLTTDCDFGPDLLVLLIQPLLRLMLLPIEHNKWMNRHPEMSKDDSIETIKFPKSAIHSIHPSAQCHSI